jgi:hypothetical protein
MATPLHRYEVRVTQDKSSKDPWWEVMRFDWHTGKPVRVVGAYEFKHQAQAVAKVMTQYARSEVR